DPAYLSVNMYMNHGTGPTMPPYFGIQTTTTAAPTGVSTALAISTTPPDPTGNTGIVRVNGSFTAGGDIVLAQPNKKLVAVHPWDIRLKTDVQDLPNAAEKLASLRGVSYRYCGPGPVSRPRDIGVIAQEVEQVLPELVRSSPVTGLKGVDYGKLNTV